MAAPNRPSSPGRLRQSLPYFLFIAALIFCAAFAASAATLKKKTNAPRAKAARSKAPLSPEAAVARWMASLSLRDKVAQLVIVPFNGLPFRHARDAAKFNALISHEHVGGMVLVNVADNRTVAKPQPLPVATFINRMQGLSRIPLLVAGDFERGASMRLDSTTVFPHAMAFTASGDPAEARIEAEITARESRAIGFQWLFFPDADVNNNPDNPIINIRSYGEDPAAVSRFVSAFIDGAHHPVGQSDSMPGARVLVTAKHFPGHGDTATDTHMNLATVTADRPRLEALEWAPFRAAVESGVDSIMTAHLAVPALDDPLLPATLSPKILTGILRDELHFQGLIVTDALDMGGIAHGFSVGDAAVRAVEAGADVLLMPSDPKSAIDAVVAAVNSGRLTTKRIDDSVMRVLMAKARVGLATSKTVDVSQLPKILNTPASVQSAQRIADRAVTLVRNEHAVLPLRKADGVAFYVLTEGAISNEGNAFTAELRLRYPQATVVHVDSVEPEAELNALPQPGDPAREYVVVAFASVAANRGATGLNGALPHLVQNLIATKKPVIFVALGNPYLLRTFPEVAAYMATYSTVPPSELAALRALFGEIPVTGKLPVSIPGFAKVGDGITLAAQCCAKQ